MIVSPHDLAEIAAEAEEWAATDWQQWHALCDQLERLGAQALEARWPPRPAMLTAVSGKAFPDETVSIDHAQPKPTLDALMRLANQLQPPMPGTANRAASARWRDSLIRREGYD
jgi:hypothetical protein